MGVDEGKFARHDHVECAENVQLAVRIVCSVAHDENFSDHGSSSVMIEQQHMHTGHFEYPILYRRAGLWRIRPVHPPYHSNGSFAATPDFSGLALLCIIESLHFLMDHGIMTPWEK
jgi:hypothetical protein